MTAVATGDDGKVEPTLYELIVRAFPDFEQATAWMDDVYRKEMHWGVAAAFYHFAVNEWRQGRIKQLKRILDFVEVICAGDNATYENAICLDFVQGILGTDTMGDFVPLLGPSARACYEAKVRDLLDHGISIVMIDDESNSTR